MAVNLGWVDELDAAAELFRSLREAAVERAEASALPWILAHLGLVETYAGRWEQAMEAADAACEHAAQSGQEPQRAYGLAVRSLVRANRGELDDARADAEEARALAGERGVMIAEILSASALAMVELSRGNPGAAHAVLGPLGERLERGGVREPGSVRFVADNIEALIGVGRVDEAEAVLEQLEERARRLDRVSVLASAARCRGLVAAARGDLDGALASLGRALAEHQRVLLPLDRARTVLAIGMTQRRAKQRRAARDSLERACALFEELGAQQWAERARMELDRVSGRRPSKGELTATELRIAQLVSEGRSNKEIAAAVFLTPKTVETKLSRIYAKLGVHSRTELAHRLSQPPPATKL
jgi:DNA-binding NarL/FixJ family response regulator